MPHNDLLKSRPHIFANRIAGASGVTGGAALTIPALLFPQEIRGKLWTLAEITRMQRLPDDNVGKDSCFRLKGEMKLQKSAIAEEVEEVTV